MEERLKDQGLLRGRDPETRIHHGKVQVHRRPALLQDLHLDDHLAALGELDRVPHQVEDHLPKTAGITDDAIRNVGRDVADQLEPLRVRANGHRLQGVVQAVTQLK